MVDGENPTDLLQRARAGESEALNELVEMYRNYLQILARVQIGNHLRTRVDSSDLVQETLLEACRDFQQFVGTTERQLTSWLRQILVRNIANEAKRHRALKRDSRRECELLDRSSVQLEQLLVANVSSPSAQVARRELSVILADGLATLPDDHRDVLVMRHLEELPFDEIAVRMERSSDAVRQLWVRALRHLREELEGMS